MEELLVGELGRQKSRAQNQEQVHKNGSKNGRLDDSDLVILEGDTSWISMAIMEGDHSLLA